MGPVDLFQRGGIVMYAILVASVVGFAAFIERMWSLQGSRVIPSQLRFRIGELVADARYVEASALCEGGNTPAHLVFMAALRRAGEPLLLIKDAVEEVGRQQAVRLERFIWILGTVASVSPLLGLLGTVTGMIAVFQAVAETGVGSPLEMASGIWEALLTTAFGLMVGIVTLFLHRYTLNRVDASVLKLEEAALSLVELMHRVGTARPAAGALL